MNDIRDTIVVAGPFGSGKTFFLNILRDHAQTLGVPFEYVPISDAHTIKARLEEDDLSGGLNHYHPFNRQEALRGNNYHVHDSLNATLPFTVAGNEIIVNMTRDFLNRLSQAPHDHRLKFAEWSMGKNTNVPWEPAFQTNAFSCYTISRYLQDGIYPSDGFKRVYAIIHPATTLPHRIQYNKGRSTPTQDEIRLGRKSWGISAEGMRITGRDNFDALVPTLKRLGIPFIVSIDNRDDETKYERYWEALPELRQRLRQIILRWRTVEWRGSEGGPRRKEWF